MKKLTSMLLVLAMMLSCTMPALAWNGADGLLPDEPDLQPGSAAVQQLAQSASEAAAAQLPVAADYSVSQPLAVEETTLSADETYLLNVVLFAVDEYTDPAELALDDLDLREITPVFTDEDGAPRAVGERGNVWFRAYTAQDADAVAVALAALDGVICAEPDYVYTQDSIGKPTEEETAGNWAFDALLGDGNGDLWWNSALENDFAPGSDVIVAVIDTGVDYSHEDLAASMWVNEAELNGTPGVDDDGNGIIDDVYGANVTATGAAAGNPMDDHGHGTHVAGIIGMSANATGGVGLAWGAKIMAIKAGQSTGTFSSSHIAKAISYAQMMGADVINMSFGGTSKSLLVEDALAEAFTTCVLVASAGNNGLPTTDAPPSLYPKREDIYPAGYNYVLGVMATDESGSLASFSNWDYTNNANCEYELTAPGVSISSTLPGNRYASWSGTSMAAPCVAAAAAILRSQYPDKDTWSSRFIMGQLVSATEDATYFTAPMDDSHTSAALNIYDSILNMPQPNITVREVFLLDSTDISEKNDGDAIIDAGEIIDMGLAVRNQWGLTGEITVTADAISDGGVASPHIEFINDTVTLQPAGTFQQVDNGFTYDDSLLVSVSDPIRFKVLATATHDAEVRINLTVTTTNGWDTNDTATYTVVAEKTFRINAGRGISGTLTEDTTLTSDYLWVVENTLYIPAGITLTIEPGTKVQFYSSDYEDAYGGKTIAAINCEGTLNAIGTEEQPIEMYPGAGFEQYCVVISGNGDETLQYCKITNPRLGYNGVSGSFYEEISTIDHCELVQNFKAVTYRYLDGTSVKEKYIANSKTNGPLQVNRLSNSVLRGLRPDYGNYCVIDVCEIDNCVFEQCNIKIDYYYSNFDTPFQVKMTNSVLLQGDSKKRLDVDIVDKIYNPTVVFDETIYTDSDTGTRYIIMGGFKNVYYSDSYDGGYALAKAYATALNGKVLCISDEEELEFLTQTMHSILESGRSEGSSTTLYRSIGLGYIWNEDAQAYCWDDGSDYSATIPPSGGSNYPFGYILFSSTPDAVSVKWNATRSTNDSDMYYMLEVPAALSDEEILETIQRFDMRDFLLSAPVNAPAVTNNAILNPTLSTDPEMWARLISAEFTDYVTSSDYFGASVAGNYYGTENKTLINKMILDADDYPGVLCNLIEDPILTLESPELESIYPFVTRVYLTDEDGSIVSNVSAGASYTVHVTFNRDMAQDVQPSVTFGGESPYTDYAVSGDFVSAREWCGTVKISPVLTGGTMYWRTEGGAAADDRWLVCGEDVLRFSFNIGSTGTLAMVLNAQGGANKVELSWAQNDYDTLAGYNIYRSTSQESGFKKINTSIVTGNSYTDTDVAPGVTYYYYFKVVNTDGNEEAGVSNTASGTPIDNIRPVLRHAPVTAAKAGTQISLSATATDNIGITAVKLFYRKGGSTAFTEVKMTTGVTADLYTATIPASAVTAAGVEYYITASDADGNTAYSGTAEIPNRIVVDSRPYISNITPTSIDTAGGRTITLLGGNLSEEMVLKVGSVTIADSEKSFIDAGQITFIAPAMASGTYSVTLTAADGTVYTAPSALSYTDSGSVAQIPTTMEMVSNVAYTIPLYASASGDVISLHAELDLPNADFTSVTVEKADADANYVLDYTYSGGLLKIGCFGSANILPADGPMLNIVVTPRVSEDKQYEITLHDVAFNGVAVSDTISGTALIRPSFVIAAQVSYYSDAAAPVSGVSVVAAGVTALTDESGKATLTVSTKDVTISAQYAEPPAGAITAFDASLVLQSAVGRITLTDYQRLAADVDGNGEVNEYDAALILQMSVNKIDAFPVSYRWVFVPSSIQKTLSDSGENQVSFIAIALGDVDGSYKEVS